MIQAFIFSGTPFWYIPIIYVKNWDFFKHTVRLAESKIWSLSPTIERVCVGGGGDLNEGTVKPFSHKPYIL